MKRSGPRPRLDAEAPAGDDVRLMRRFAPLLALGLLLLTPAVAKADEVPSPPEQEEKKDEDKKDEDKSGESKKDDADGDEKKSGCAVASPTDGAIGSVALGLMLVGGAALARRRRD